MSCRVTGDDADDRGLATHLESTLSLDGDKYGALLSFGVLGVQGQVGASHDTDSNFSIDEQPEADCVLTTSKETLGAIDGIQGPVTTLTSARRVATVDNIEPVLL